MILNLGSARRAKPAWVVSKVLVLLGGLLWTCCAAYAGCDKTALYAHRGAPLLPENSLSAVVEAASGRWTGVELDIQRLGSGEWVLHHDLQTGRTTSVSGKPVSRLNSLAWNETLMRGRDGKLTSERAPYLRDVFPHLAESSAVLNIEVKQRNPGCRIIDDLVSELRTGLPAGNWFLSAIDRQLLKCARRADPSGYLGLVVLDARSLAATNSRSSQYGTVLEAPKMTAEWMDRLIADLGKPLGLHVDVLTLRTQPSMLTLASAREIAVFVYGFTGDEDLAESIAFVSSRTSYLPSGIIIDGDPEPFCRKLY